MEIGVTSFADEVLRAIEPRATEVAPRVREELVRRTESAAA
jgi:hypothetical protein